MRTVRDARSHADRLVGDSAARRFRIFLSVSETWKSATVGQDGSARSIGVAVVVAASSAGHSGAASAPWEHVHRHFAVAALLVARNAAYPSGGPKIDSHVDFDSTAAWRHHVSMPPSSRSQSAATTALTAGICELFRVKRLREIPHWWILGRCGPPTDCTPSVLQKSDATKSKNVNDTKKCIRFQNVQLQVEEAGRRGYRSGTRLRSHN